PTNAVSVRGSARGSPNDVKCARTSLPRLSPLGQTDSVRSSILTSMARPCFMAAALALTLATAAPAAMPATPGPPASADTGATTVVLVRHADKDTNVVGSDPPLSAAGMVRAQELARVLGDVRFSAIYVTPWARSRQTAEPIARRLGDTLTVVD